MSIPREFNGKLRLYHCKGARSFRALWMLEELEIAYELTLLPFPPRKRAKDFLAINPLGTVPFLILEEGFGMSESTAIVEYLGARFAKGRLTPNAADGSGYARYLNFLHMADATLTFPQTLYLRYTQLEAPADRVPRVAEDYRRWFLARLDAALTMFAGDYCCGERFTAADIAVGYAIKLACTIGLREDLPEPATAYFERLKSRDGYNRAMAAERA